MLEWRFSNSLTSRVTGVWRGVTAPAPPRKASPCVKRFIQRSCWWLVTFLRSCTSGRGGKSHAEIRRFCNRGRYDDLVCPDACTSWWWRLAGIRVLLIPIHTCQPCSRSGDRSLTAIGTGRQSRKTPRLMAAQLFDGAMSNRKHDRKKAVYAGR